MSIPTEFLSFLRRNEIDISRSKVFLGKNISQQITSSPDFYDNILMTTKNNHVIQTLLVGFYYKLLNENLLVRTVDLV